MALDASDPAPLVSVIIPVYNAEAFLPSTLDSLRRQALPTGRMEIIAVDDGSTDGSAAVLAAHARTMPELTVLHQENSGGPGGPRNAALDRARGEFVFFLDADDELADAALAELIAVAEAVGSDIVVAKMGGLNGRRPPATMFTRSRLDADLVEDRLFNTLSPLKLFRRELIERVGARFPTHLTLGEDQPFTAALYLRAEKISICADREYILIRARGDGSNLTAQRHRTGNTVELVQQLMRTILEHTEPGDRRDALIRRPLRTKVAGLLGPSLLGAPAAEQRAIVDGLAEAMEGFAPQALRSHVDPLTAIRISLCRDRDLDTLLRLLEWESATDGGEIVAGPEGLAFAFPADLTAAIGPERMATPAVRGLVRLDAVSTGPGVLHLTASAAAPKVPAPATAIRLELVHRTEGTTIDRGTTDAGPATVAGRPGRTVTAEITPADLAPGLWDVFLVQWHGEQPIRRRLGADRSAEVTGEPLYLDEDGVGGAALARAYFTEGHGNLSLDVGFTLEPDPRPAVTVLGVLAAPGPAVLLSAAERTTLLRAVDASGTDLDAQLHALSEHAVLLTVDGPDAARIPAWIELGTDHGPVLRVLPAAVGLPSPATDPGSGRRGRPAATAGAAASPPGAGTDLLRRLRRAPRSLAARGERRRPR